MQIKSYRWRRSRAGLVAVLVLCLSILLMPFPALGEESKRDSLIQWLKNYEEEERERKILLESLKDITHKLLGSIVKFQGKEVPVVGGTTQYADMTCVIRYRDFGSHSEARVLRNAGRLLKAIFENPACHSCKEAKVFPNLLFMDKYGKDEERRQMEVGLSRKVADKVNWDNLLNTDSTRMFKKLLKEEGHLRSWMD